jgi:hypothetical protein
VKKRSYTDILCGRFCKYYKRGKEGLACGTYDFLARNLTAFELKSAIDCISSDADFIRDKEIEDRICSRCDFLVDGCDFKSGVEAPPCGGYIVLGRLFKKPRVD